jgi:hypothetical protein
MMYDMGVDRQNCSFTDIPANTVNHARYVIEYNYACIILHVLTPKHLDVHWSFSFPKIGMKLNSCCCSVLMQSLHYCVQHKGVLAYSVL